MDHKVVLPCVSLGSTARLPDRPGDMEREIARAVTRTAAELTALAKRDRVVLIDEPAEVVIIVSMKVTGVQIPEDLDIEEIRRHVSFLPRAAAYNGVLWNTEPEPGSAF